MRHTKARIGISDGTGVRVARFHGTLDVFSSSAVGSRIFAGMPADAHEVVIDLDDVDRMDSAGVSALVRLRERARARHVDLRCHLGRSRVNPTIRQVLARVMPVDDVQPTA